ncbi:MAG: S8 family peptidase [Ginsengibacter sp.]
MKIPFLLLFIVFSLHTSAQSSRYVVQFTDKKGSLFSIDNPSKYLSQRSIDRRIKQHIPLDETDLPLSQIYIDSIRLTGNVQIINQSKWLNQVCIETEDIDAITKINSYPFVKKMQAVKKMSIHEPFIREKFNQEFKKIAVPNKTQGLKDALNYGNAFGQIHLHEGEFLHNKGYRGEGMLLAVIDAGFYRYKTLPAFDSVNLNNQIIDTWDFVKNKASVNEEHPHGMHCFSIIASNIPGKLIGTSPKANFLLYRSEDVDTESPMEEQYWIVAMERADSIGADISTTSLGYNTFDNPAFNYSYADLNGKTTMMAKAATMAARKGMIVLASAGNEGDKPWKFITTPADADSILSVGAVDASGIPGSFSSYGPAADGRIAPTVASVGVNTFVSNTGGGISNGNGTSFSSPNLAGLVACFWQAFPEFTNMEIIAAIKRSSSTFKNPNDRIGYGIPNFRLAYEDLEKQRTKKRLTAILGENDLKVFPIPFKDQFTVAIKPQNTALATFLLYTNEGRLITSQQISLNENEVREVKFTELQPLQRGVYILKFIDGKSQETIQLLKK